MIRGEEANLKTSNGKHPPTPHQHPTLRDISLEDLKKIKQIIRLNYFYDTRIQNGGLKRVWAVRPMDFEI